MNWNTSGTGGSGGSSGAFGSYGHGVVVMDVDANPPMQTPPFETRWADGKKIVRRPAPPPPEWSLGQKLFISMIPIAAITEAVWGALHVTGPAWQFAALSAGKIALLGCLWYAVKDQQRLEGEAKAAKFHDDLLGIRGNEFRAFSDQNGNVRIHVPWRETPHD